MNLSDVRLERKRSQKRIDYERVRLVVGQIKEMVRNEPDRSVKVILASAGNELNKILLR